MTLQSLDLGWGRGVRHRATANLGSQSTTWDPGGTAQVREIALVMVEQGPNLGLGWAKSHGSSGVLCGEVLWCPMCERRAQQQLGPLRAGLTSATPPASGSRSRRGGYYRLLHQLGSASLKTERLLYPKLQTSTMGEACCGPSALLLPMR